MKTLTGKCNWFKGEGMRLDPSFHLSDGRMATLTIKKSPYPIMSLEDITRDLFNGARFKRYYVTSLIHGTQFMGNGPMLKTDHSALKLISNKYTKNLTNLILDEKWVLISCSGTVGGTFGRAVFTNKDFIGKAASQHVLRVIPNSKKIKPGCLFAFLASKIGYSLLTQGTYGSAIKHIEPQHIRHIPIPTFPNEMQNNLDMLINESAELRVNANTLLSEVQEILKAKLKTDKDSYYKMTSHSEKDIGNIYSVCASRISSKTFRARNYSIRKAHIIDHLKGGQYDRLIDVLEKEPFYGSRFKRIETNSEKGIELLSQGDLFDIKPSGRRISVRNIHNIKNEVVAKGTILIPAQGTLGENEIFGRAKFTWGYLEEKLVAGHAMRFIPNPNLIPEGYLFAVLSSEYWFRMLRDCVYGTNLLGFIVPLINELPIPRFDIEIEQSIDKKVKLAYKHYTIANQIEKSAIMLVEEEMKKWQ